MSGRSLQTFGLWLALPALFLAACGRSEDDSKSGGQASETPPPAEGAVAWDSDRGITISVIKFESQLSSTTVVFQVAGRDELGDHARVGEPMRDQYGGFVMPSRGNSDGRTVTMSYGAIPSEAGTVTALIRRVELWDKAEHQTAVAQNSPVAWQGIEGRWELKIPFDGSQATAIPAQVESGAVPFGPGDFELLSATIEFGVLVIQGRLGGFSLEQVPALGVEAALVDEAGTTIRPNGLRIGFGDNRSGLTIQFAVPPAGEYQVQLKMGEPSHPFEPTPVAQLKPFVGAMAERGVTVP